MAASAANVVPCIHCGILGGAISRCVCVLVLIAVHSLAVSRVWAYRVLGLFVRTNYVLVLAVEYWCTCV